MSQKFLVDEQKICKLYNSGLSVQKISDILGISNTPIIKCLKRHKISMRSISEANRIYTTNKNFFDSIDNEEKAYILGYLAADGHVNSNTGRISLDLQDRDAYILEKMLKIMESDLKVRRVKRKDGSFTGLLLLQSIHMSKKLADLGLSQHKTFDLRFPNIDKKLFHHYLRGYNDGDGCICLVKRMAQVNIVSSRIFINQLKEFLLQELGINGRITGLKNTDERVAGIWIGGNQQVMKLLNYIYKDATIYLERKYDKYMVVKKLVDSIDLKRSPPFCTILNCERKNFGHGLCGMHYKKYYKGKLTRIPLPI